MSSVSTSQVKSQNLFQNMAFSRIHTGKFLSEALIFASNNPQYDDRLFIELQGVFSKPSGNHIVAQIFCFLS